MFIEVLVNGTREDQTLVSCLEYLTIRGGICKLICTHSACAAERTLLSMFIHSYGGTEHLGLSPEDRLEC